MCKCKANKDGRKEMQSKSSRVNCTVFGPNHLSSLFLKGTHTFEYLVKPKCFSHKYTPVHTPKVSGRKLWLFINNSLTLWREQIHWGVIYEIRANVWFCREMNGNEDKEGELWVTSVRGTAQSCTGSTESCWLPFRQWQIASWQKLLKASLEYSIKCKNVQETKQTKMNA